MKFEDAIRLSISNFLNGKLPDELGKLNEEGLTYTPEWFDTFEETLQKEEELKAETMDEEDDAPRKPRKKKKQPPKKSSKSKKEK